MIVTAKPKVLNPRKQGLSVKTTKEIIDEIYENKRGISPSNPFINKVWVSVDSLKKDLLPIREEINRHKNEHTLLYKLDIILKDLFGEATNKKEEVKK
jgi:hypothetical protein